jgi:N-acetylneuraminic acid mutarotase
VDEKRTAQRRLFYGHGLFALLICIAAAGSILSGTLLAFFRPEASTKVSERTLTFAERVSYQRAIEDVYWRHRIWPKERPDPKPSLDEVVPSAQLEKKVADYLRDSQALEDHWQRPITADQLQAEMDRMAQHTNQPEVLREVFAALGNDPFVIAECLVRPVLAERLIGDLSVHGETQRFDFPRTNGLRTMSAVTALGHIGYTIPRIADEPSTCLFDNWTATSTTNAVTAREYHTAVWSGSEMIVWGGSGDAPFGPTGGRYNPSTDTWTATSTANAPTARGDHTAVWTGTEMIVWGGVDRNLLRLNTGGRYNPATDSWTATSTTNVPDVRESHTAVWTGSEMIVWGGSPNGGFTFFNTGGRYNPSTDTWTATSTANAPTARESHTAVWTGSEMIVWGGYGNGNSLNTGGRYNPSTDTWAATNVTNAPSARILHREVWTGSEMIVWGGTFDGSFNHLFNTGGRYNPATDSWTATSTTNVPDAREYHTAVWTGTQMIVWGGQDFNGSFLTTGGRYDPSTDSWTATSTTNVPGSGINHTAIWSGTEMIVWGGFNGSGYLNTGGRYCAQPSATPTPTSTATPTATATATATPTATPRFAPTPRPRPTPPPRP